MRICLWRYRDNTRNYPGFHLSADPEGCLVLRDLLGTGRQTTSTPLHSVDAEILEVPNNLKGEARWTSWRRFRIQSFGDEAPETFEFAEDGETLLLTCSRAQIGCILKGVEDMESGRGDYCIGGDGEHVLWFWWQ